MKIHQIYRLRNNRKSKGRDMIYGFHVGLVECPYSHNFKRFNFGNIKKKGVSFIEGLKLKIMSKIKTWQDHTIQNIFLAFSSLREPYLFSFNPKKKVNCPIDFKTLTS